jgi:hypothetical protein
MLWVIKYVNIRTQMDKNDRFDLNEIADKSELSDEFKEKLTGYIYGLIGEKIDKWFTEHYDNLLEDSLSARQNRSRICKRDRS